MAVLLDTTCFIALERRKLPLSALGAALADRAVAVSAVTASELLVGVHMADSQSRRARRSAFVEALLESLPIMPFDLQCARIHAQLRAQLRADGSERCRWERSCKVNLPTLEATWPGIVVRRPM